MTAPRPAAPSAPSSQPPTLVVGGAGFIGSHLVDALLAAGAEVRVLDDLSLGRAAHLPLHDPNLELQVGDMMDPAAVAEAVDGMGRIVHLAAQPPRPGRDPYEAELANVLGFVNVLDAALVKGVKRVVYASSAAVYGQGDDAPRHEDAPTAPVDAGGMARMVMESYAAFYARQHGLSPLGLRYFNVFGARQERGIVPGLIDRIGRRRPALLHGDGQQTRDFIAVADAVRLTLAALDSPAVGVCNVGTGERTSLRELTRMIGLAFDCQPLLHFAPARLDDIRYSQADTRRQREWLGAAPRGLLGALAEQVAAWDARERRAARTSRIRRAALESPPAFPLPAPPAALPRRALSS